MLYTLYKCVCVYIYIYNNYKAFLMFECGCKLMVLMYSLLTESDGNCRKTDNKFAPQNLSLKSLN